MSTNECESSIQGKLDGRKVEELVHIFAHVWGHFQNTSSSPSSFMVGIVYTQLFANQGFFLE